jgi:hypothetical protein
LRHAGSHYFFWSPSRDGKLKTSGSQAISNEATRSRRKFPDLNRKSSRTQTREIQPVRFIEPHNRECDDLSERSIWDRQAHVSWITDRIDVKIFTWLADAKAMKNGEDEETDSGLVSMTPTAVKAASLWMCFWRLSTELGHRRSLFRILSLHNNTHQQSTTELLCTRCHASLSGCTGIFPATVPLLRCDTTSP